MRLTTLPPAGVPIDWRQQAEPGLSLPGYRLRWVQSGTAALAFCLLHQHRRFPSVKRPQVIVPAYCCPDLVAAAVYAGFEAVVVDIQAEDPGFDLEALSGAITDQTLAVIAINFMGVAEQLEPIRTLLAPHPQVALVEDNAQWFPSPEQIGELEGDFVTFSFGRGKAIGLLGGGLVAVREALQEEHEPDLEPAASASRWPAKAWLVNQLSRPSLYHWVTRLPFLSLGQTVYHPLERLAEMPECIKAAFSANYAEYCERDRCAERWLDGLFSEGCYNGFAPLFSARRRQLLRYPLLCESAADKTMRLEAFNQAGLGATALYQRPLIEVQGVQGLPVKAPFGTPNAEAFASRLITLPVHTGVKSHHLDAMSAILNRE